MILLAGVIVGLQTYQTHGSPSDLLLERIDLFILVFFTVEIAVRMMATAPHFGRYFTDPWNLFDFSIVAVCWLAHLSPDLSSGFFAVIRLARVLRVMRLVQALKQLKLLINAMLHSIPSMGYVGLLLFLLFYIYGVMGVFLFAQNDPLHFSNLHTAMITLFQVSTLEGWNEIFYVNIHGCDHPEFGYGDAKMCATPLAQPLTSVIYFVSFVLIGTMIVLNLFIGVIVNSMDEVRSQQEFEERIARKKSGELTPADELEEMGRKLDELKTQLDQTLRQMQLNKKSSDP